jgi:hypothetical protein
MDGGPQLRAALDELPRNTGDEVVFVDNGARGPSIIDTRALPPGGWAVEGLLPGGAVAAVADLDDPSPGTLLENGFDVVLRFAGRGAMDAGPVLVSVHWREGLVPGREPPPPFWVRFDPSRFGFVRVDGEPEAA